MKEHVSELTPEEFQKTFPIELKDVISEYTDWYKEEEKAIIDIIGADSIVRINHIGSSAIPNIKANMQGIGMNCIFAITLSRILM